MLDDALAPIRNYLARTEHLVIGLMTGTSADAVDAVLVRFRGVGIDARHEVLAYHESEMDGALRARVLELAGARSLEPELLLRVDAALGECYAAAVLDLLAGAGLERERVSAIGSHGQTIRHVPRASGGGTAFTLQIGSAAVLAERTGIPSSRISARATPPRAVRARRWFRWRIGGCFARRKNHACCSIWAASRTSRICRAVPRCDRVLAFDTGPCNAVLDALAATASGGRERHDAGGALALAGGEVRALVEERLSDPYLLAGAATLDRPRKLRSRLRRAVARRRSRARPAARGRHGERGRRFPPKR